ncbi:MAG: hypothetical protein H6739_20435 [Alphaproteobacteria bacterium]|nr:hypothetical protein [Alphaproteobacteria bacterium]
MTFALLVSLSAASAATYEPIDLLLASHRSLPESTLGKIAEQTAGTAEEKACLLKLGVPAALVDAMEGPKPKHEASDATCAPFTEALAQLSEDEARAGAEARVEFEARRRAQAEAAAIDARVDCINPQTGAFAAAFNRPTVEEQVEVWMMARLKAGSNDFIVLPMVQGTSGEFGVTGTSLVVCSY